VSARNSTRFQNPTPLGESSSEGRLTDNLGDHLPEKMRGPGARRMREAYHANSAPQAQALLEALAKDWTRPTPRRCRQTA
jgi:hypothetical protein